MFLLTGMNFITPSVCVSPYILTVGVDGFNEPEIVIEPDRSVVPNNVLLPICVVDPLIDNEPV